MEIPAMILAFTWEEIVVILVAAGLGYLIGFLHQRLMQSPEVEAQGGGWPTEHCGETGGPAIQALMEILSLAQGAPEPQRGIINALVGQCLQHDTAHYQRWQSSSPTHCGAVKNALDAARSQDWQLCIGELTHGG